MKSKPANQVRHASKFQSEDNRNPISTNKLYYHINSITIAELKITDKLTEELGIRLVMKQGMG